jgi:hypothetical protein
MSIPLKRDQVIFGVLLTFDYLAVGLRLWARNIKSKPLQINDYLIIVGLVWIRIVTTVKAVLTWGQFFTTCLCICDVLGRILDVYSIAQRLL